MATVASTKADFTDGELVTWTPLTTTNADGAGAGFVGAGDRTIMVTGTFGTGGTVIVEGSLDGGSNWFGLRDPSSTAISFSGSGSLRAVLENVPLIRPRVTGGDGTTALTAVLYVRRNLNG